MGRNSTGKIYIKAAYRLVPVTLLITRMLERASKQLYVNVMLFPLDYIQKIIFLMLWQMLQNGALQKYVYKYCTISYMPGAPVPEECAEHLQILQRVGNNLGVPPGTKVARMAKYVHYCHMALL